MAEIILITVDLEILLMTNHVCRCLYMWIFSIYKCMFFDILLLHRTTGIYSNTNNTLHLMYRADIAVSIVLPACTNLILKNFVPPISVWLLTNDPLAHSNVRAPRRPSFNPRRRRFCTYTITTSGKQRAELHGMQRNRISSIVPHIFKQGNSIS